MFKDNTFFFFFYLHRIFIQTSRRFIIIMIIIFFFQKFHRQHSLVRIISRILYKHKTKLVHGFFSQDKKHTLISLRRL